MKNERAQLNDHLNGTLRQDLLNGNERGNIAEKVMENYSHQTKEWGMGKLKKMRIANNVCNMLYYA